MTSSSRRRNWSTGSRAKARTWSPWTENPSGTPSPRCTSDRTPPGTRPPTTGCRPSSRPPTDVSAASPLPPREGSTGAGMATTHIDALPGTSASAEPAGDLHRNVEVLFEEWEAQQTHVDLSDLTWEDSIVFVIFWVLFGVVFLQFYTRYVLNDSLGWTEEIARYLLIGVTFVGSMMAMRK